MALQVRKRANVPHCSFVTSQKPYKCTGFCTSFVVRSTLLRAVLCAEKVEGRRSDLERMCKGNTPRQSEKMVSCSNVLPMWFYHKRERMFTRLASSLNVSSTSLFQFGLNIEVSLWAPPVVVSIKGFPASQFLKIESWLKAVAGEENKNIWGELSNPHTKLI